MYTRKKLLALMVMILSYASAPRVACASESVTPAQTQALPTKFFPLPPRRTGSVAVTARSAFYAVKPSTQKPAKVATSQAAVENFPPPPAGDKHKLLLYVYDEMR